jgi:hypothetical protein
MMMCGMHYVIKGTTKQQAKKTDALSETRYEAKCVNTDIKCKTEMNSAEHATQGSFSTEL